MKIYVIEEHCDGIHTKDIGYSTVRKDVDNYLSSLTGAEACYPATIHSPMKWFYEKYDSKIFQKHQPGIWYRSKTNLYLYSFRIEETI